MSYTLLTLLHVLNIFVLTPSIDVIYPRPLEDSDTSYIARVDSNFIFGSIHPTEAMLSINGIEVKVEENGAFITFVPLDWNNKRYELTAIHDGDSARYNLLFDVYPPAKPITQPDLTLPRLIELKGGVARTHPKGAYYLFPDSGTVVFTDAWQNGYYRLPLTGNHSVWIQGKYVIDNDTSAIQTGISGDSEPAIIPEIQAPVVWKGRIVQSDRWVDIIIPVGRKVLYRISEETDPPRIVVELFNVISHLDHFAYSPDTEPVKEVVWDQPEDRLLKLYISLSQPCWGYKVNWNETDFIVSVRRPPVLRKGVKGLNITIDPGHGGNDHGAIGPTGLTEKDANLKTALVLKRLLEKKNAVVTLTRSDDTYRGLMNRINVAEDAEADILISLHHNALPDGVNPFTELGTGTYYYRPQSRDLANALQKELIKRLQLPDEGVYYNNLALVRPTAMPTVLIEAAYIMLPEHEALIKSEEYPEKLVEAIYKGLCRHLKETKKHRKRD